MYRDKKNRWYLITQVERGTRCYVSWRVAAERDSATLQAVVNAAPAAQQYYSDALPAYDALVYYPGHHQSLPNKSQTYAVEADNAELRHYLARLARRSRCFSRSEEALHDAVKVFIFAWNRRQLARRAHPQYSAPVRDFVYP